MCRSKLANAKKGVKMNIHNQQPTVTNFKGIQQEIMSDFGKHGRKYRESIANNFNTLLNSDVVDLAYDNSGKNIILRTKKLLKNITTCGEDLPAGTEIKLNAATNSKIDGSQLIVKDLDITQDLLSNELAIELGTPENAKKALQPLNFSAGDTYADKLPYLGAMIDASHRIAEPLKQIRTIMADTLYK